MAGEYEGTWITGTEAAAMLGVSMPTFYKLKRENPEKLKTSAGRKYLDLDVIELAALLGIRAKQAR